MPYQQRETNWKSFAKHNSYCFDTMITCDDVVFLALDLITNEWVLSRIVHYPTGFAPDQSFEPELYQSTIDAINAFNYTCKHKGLI